MFKELPSIVNEFIKIIVMPPIHYCAEECFVLKIRVCFVLTFFEVNSNEDASYKMYSHELKRGKKERVLTCKFLKTSLFIFSVFHNIQKTNS